MKTSKKTSSTDSLTRNITVKNNTIIFTLKATGTKDYATYNETLLYILSLDRLKPFSDRGRLRFYYRLNKTDISFSFSTLSYGCYTNQIKKDTFIADIQRLNDYKYINNLVIDHADSNHHNNTILNLSIMTRSLNSKKRDIIARVKQPNSLFIAYYNNKYFIALEHGMVCPELSNSILSKFSFDISTDTFCKIRLSFECLTAEDLVEKLNALISANYEWASPLKGSENYTPYNGTYWADDVNHSIKIQNLLITDKTINYNKFM